MKKTLLSLVFLILLSCSSDDKGDCKKVTGLSAKEIDGVWVYTIEIDNGDPITTNKATVDFYKHNEAPECFEGMK